MKKEFSWLLRFGAACLLAGCAASQAAPPAPSVQATAKPADAAKPADESLTINFDLATATLSPEANLQLDGAARLYRDARPQVMTVSGHSDKSGEEFANLVLSARRADMVKKGLVGRGIPAERLQIVAYGEAELAANVVPSRSTVVTWR